MLRQEVSWRRIHDKFDDEGQLVDRFSISEPAGKPPRLSVDLVSQHTEGRAGCGGTADTAGEGARGLDELRQAGLAADPIPKPRQVVEAVEELLQNCDVTEWISVQIEEQVTEKYRQEQRGLPGQRVHPGRSCVHTEAPDRAGALDEEARCDGTFPLVSNDLAITEQELLLAYKQQPAIQRRSST